LKKRIIITVNERGDSMLIKEEGVEECDARMLNSSTSAGLIKNLHNSANKKGNKERSLLPFNFLIYAVMEFLVCYEKPFQTFLLWVQLQTCNKVVRRFGHNNPGDNSQRNKNSCKVQLP